MDEKFNVPKRARRRAYLAKVRRKARLKAERRYQDDLNATLWRKRYVLYPKSRHYIQFIKNDGHWIDGGCCRTHCWICQPHEPSGRDQRENERMRDSLREEL